MYLPEIYLDKTDLKQISCMCTIIVTEKLLGIVNYSIL